VTHLVPWWEMKDVGEVAENRAGIHLRLRLEFDPAGRGDRLGYVGYLGRVFLYLFVTGGNDGTNACEQAGR
jgi:hypothetical protein